MRKVYLLGLLLLSFLAVNAQGNLPPAYEIKSTIAGDQKIDSNYWQLLEDPAGRLSIAQVSSLAWARKFTGNYDAKMGVDYHKHYFWMRFRLKNAMTEKANICLTNSNMAERCDFFVSGPLNRQAHYLTGLLAPLDKMSGLKKASAIPLTLAPGEELLIYERIENSYYFVKPVSFELSIAATEQLIRENYVEGESSYSFQNFSIFFLGILAFGFILNLLFYAIERKKVYLYFSLFVAYFSLIALDQLVILNNPLIFATIDSIGDCFGIFLFVGFSRHFFNTSRRTPEWDKALIAIAWCHLAGSLAAFLIEPHISYKATDIFITIKQALFLIGLLMIMITYFKFLNDRDRLIRMLLVAAIPASVNWFVGFGLLYTFRFMNHFLHRAPPSFAEWLYKWYNTINVACVMWFVLAFSWVLLLQFIDLKKQNAERATENERLAKEKEMERALLIEEQNAVLEVQVAERTADLKRSLDELKQTQNQLIQSEKMASLGELTAGIAHEIQNPLNFVINFSDVNQEMLQELKAESEKPAAQRDARLETELIGDLIESEKKINHHGKRADAIVKGMLQHSRTTSGRKELTDLNALAEEYLRLAFHGLRAKDKDFNAELKTNLDPKLPRANIIPQDVGRVLLNVINNAFYAVQQKHKIASANYTPEVSLSTSMENGQVKIQVKDNGIGIPEAIKDKIMQPFFTTKPTGEGTGLGLSLSYDIVVKGHGGDIDVDSKEGEFTKLIISLPV